jgi:hypothetical protein
VTTLQTSFQRDVRLPGLAEYTGTPSRAPASPPFLRLLYTECGQVVAFRRFQFASGFLSCSLIAASKRYSSHQQPGSFPPLRQVNSSLFNVVLPTHICHHLRIRCNGLAICELGLPLRPLARARSTRPNFETRTSHLNNSSRILPPTYPLHTPQPTGKPSKVIHHSSSFFLLSAVVLDASR